MNERAFKPAKKFRVLLYLLFELCFVNLYLALGHTHLSLACVRGLCCGLLSRVPWAFPLRCEHWACAPVFFQPGNGCGFCCVVPPGDFWPGGPTATRGHTADWRCTQMVAGALFCGFWRLLPASNVFYPRNSHCFGLLLEICFGACFARDTGFAVSRCFQAQQIGRIYPTSKNPEKIKISPGFLHPVQGCC